MAPLKQLEPATPTEPVTEEVSSPPCAHYWESAGDGTEYCPFCLAERSHLGVYMPNKTPVQP